eukprot:scaffold123770_cov71-Cyclotella_meneghiniana.AAC.4
MDQILQHRLTLWAHCLDDALAHVKAIHLALCFGMKAVVRKNLSSSSVVVCGLTLWVRDLARLKVYGTGNARDD